MYEISVETEFNATHHIRLPNGDVEPDHEHRWRVVAAFAGTELDDAGMLVDFELARRRLTEVIAPLEHANLNDCPALGNLSPTAERVAKTVYDALAKSATIGHALHAVTVTEAPGCSATFSNAPPA